MARLKMTTVPEKILREVATPVTVFDDELVQFARDMIETMYAEKGIGLAANQVGDSRAVAVVDVSEERDNPLIFINPVIVEISEELEESDEGCLSLPTLFSGPVWRAKKVKVKAQNLQGEFFEVEAEELYARCLQHEVDHLNGKLYIDHLSRLKQERILKKWERILRERKREIEAEK